MNTATMQRAVGKLRGALAMARARPEYQEMFGAQEAVLARFQPLFEPENLPDLTAEAFQDFLLLRNNRHWTLQRKGPQMCEDLDVLRQALMLLVDETRPIDERLTALVNGEAKVPYLGRATLTAILLVMYPDKYGVWNRTSEASMQVLNVWPEFKWGAPFGERYLLVNAVLNKLARELEIDLWTLDGLWWFVLNEETEAEATPHPEALAETSTRFGLERHLHHFLFDNWANTELGQEWDLYEADGESGSEYPTTVGRIDLLAKHKTEPRWLVIELKRNQTDDATVGQVLRYVGWVQSHLVSPGETVEGLIIAQSATRSLHYALRSVSNVTMQRYQVDFHLYPLDPNQEPAA